MEIIDEHADVTQRSLAAPTLAQAIAPAMVDPEQLKKDYGSVINIVRELIGVVPNCNPVLEIWPPGFRTFNVLIPNLLNLPAALIGQGAPKDLVGLGMFVSSRESGCMYCTAHHCSFAIRRGNAVETIVEGDYTPPQAAVAEFAKGVARIPTELTKEKVDEVGRYLDDDDVEWLALALAVGGFLNKFMDTMGIELEHETIRDVEPLIGDQGWAPGKHQWDDELHLDQLDGDGTIPADDFKTILRVFRQAPGAIRYDARSTKGVSGRPGPALLMLEEQLGYSFPILASLHHKKAVKAVATVLRDNLDPELSEIGMEAKALTALVYARIVDDEVLTSEAVMLADLIAPELDPHLVVDVGRFAVASPESADIPAGLTREEAAAIALAKAAAPSPSILNEITIASVTEDLTPAQIVEIVVWISLLQLLHRLYAFYDARLGLV